MIISLLTYTSFFFYPVSDILIENVLDRVFVVVIVVFEQRVNENYRQNQVSFTRFFTASDILGFQKQSITTNKSTKN